MTSFALSFLLQNVMIQVVGSVPRVTNLSTTLSETFMVGGLRIPKLNVITVAVTAVLLVGPGAVPRADEGSVCRCGPRPRTSRWPACWGSSANRGDLRGVRDQRAARRDGGDPDGGTDRERHTDDGFGPGALRARRDDHRRGRQPARSGAWRDTCSVRSPSPSNSGCPIELQPFRDAAHLFGRVRGARLAAGRPDRDEVDRTESPSAILPAS